MSRLGLGLGPSNTEAAVVDMVERVWILADIFSQHGGDEDGRGGRGSRARIDASTGQPCHGRLISCTSKMDSALG